VKQARTLGAGEAELLKEMDLRGGGSVGVAIESLVGWLGSRP